MVVGCELGLVFVAVARKLSPGMSLTVGICLDNFWREWLPRGCMAQLPM
jgi:hypothetical protein